MNPPTKRGRGRPRKGESDWLRTGGRRSVLEFPPNLAVLVSRAANCLGLSARTFAMMVLAREAIYTLNAAVNRPLRIVPGGRVWALETSGTWRVACVSDGTDQVLVQDQVAGVPDTISPDHVAVSVLWVGRGVQYVCAYSDLVWDGLPPNPSGVRAFFNALFDPGAEVLDEKPPALGSPVPAAGVLRVPARLGCPDFAEPGGPVCPTCDGSRAQDEHGRWRHCVPSAADDWLGRSPQGGADSDLRPAPTGFLPCEHGLAVGGVCGRCLPRPDPDYRWPAFTNPPTVGDGVFDPELWDVHLGPLHGD